MSYHEHNERARAPRARRADARRRGRRAASATRGCRSVCDPGFVLVQGCVAAGLAVEVLPGPSAALTALVASGLPADAGGSPASCRASAAELARRCSRAPETLVAFESPRGSAATLARARRARPRAPGRRLPRADQAARGGRPRHAPPSSPTRYAGEPPRGEIVLVVGGAPAGASRRRDGGGRAPCAGSSTRARGRAPAAARRGAS